MDGTIATVLLFAGNFAPRNWAYCQGQLLPTRGNYDALFSLLGTMYGGDARTSFGLPDLRGRVLVGVGNSTGGGSNFTPGQRRTGGEFTTLTEANLPAHSHTINGNVGGTATATVKTSSSPGNSAIPAAATFASSTSGSGAKMYDSNAGTTGNGIAGLNLQVNFSGAPGMVQNTGLNHKIENRMPYLGLNYIICMRGLYPSRT